MRRSYTLGFAGTILAVSLALALIPISAQADCTAFIRAALESLADSCSSAGDGSACVHTSTAINGDGGSAVAGTIVNLSNIETMSTINDLETDVFGVSLMNVPANVPLALSETGLRYVLIGDVQVENLVDPATAFTPVEAVAVTAIVASNLRASPSTNGTIVGSVPVGTELSAFGLNGDSTWLQVLFEGRDVWVSRSIIATQGDLSTLPVLNGTTQSLMQTFQLSADSATPDCIGQPPATLLVQGPEEFGSRITVNGVDIRLDGTITLQNILSERDEDETRLKLSVLSGGAQSNNLTVPAGFTMSIVLDETGMATNSNWESLAPMSPNDLAFLSPLEALPTDVLLTDVTMPTQEQITQVLASINAGAAAQVQSNNGAIDCDGLAPTNPITDMANSVQTAFFWDPPTGEGVSGYRLTLFNEAGAVASSVDLPALSTTFVLDTTPASIGDGSNFSWGVEALVDGTVACTSGRANVIRNADQQLIGEGGGGGGAVATPTACPWANC